VNTVLQETAAADEQDVTTPRLFWVAVYLVQLEWGGHEEGGWWFEEASLVTAPDIYADLGVMPACRLSEAEAEIVATEMRPGLAALNEGRPALSSTLSRGLYDVRIVRANTLPPCIPDCPPRYE
jgi:hypothetical protein